MTAFEIAMAGCLAFGQPTGNYYEAITKHAGLQVIHADGAVTLRLREEETGGARSCTTASGSDLMERGLDVRLSGDYDSAVFEVVKTDGGTRLALPFGDGKLAKKNADKARPL